MRFPAVGQGTWTELYSRAESQRAEETTERMDAAPNDATQLTGIAEGDADQIITTYFKRVVYKSVVALNIGASDTFDVSGVFNVKPRYWKILLWTVDTTGSAYVHISEVGQGDDIAVLVPALATPVELVIPALQMKLKVLSDGASGNRITYVVAAIWGLDHEEVL